MTLFECETFSLGDIGEIYSVIVLASREHIRASPSLTTGDLKMASFRSLCVSLLTLATVPLVLGQACLNVTSEYPAAMAPGYKSKLILTGLTGARGIVFDTAGSILAVSQGTGIVHLTLSNSTDVCVTGRKTVAPDTSVSDFSCRLLLRYFLVIKCHYLVKPRNSSHARRQEVVCIFDPESIFLGLRCDDRHGNEQEASSN